MKTTKGSGTRIAGQGSNWLRRSTRWALIVRSSGQCTYCGAATDERLDIDHVRPLRGAGDNSPRNLTAACAACNGMKAELGPAGWARCLAGAWGVEPVAVLGALRSHLRTPLDRARGRQLAALEACQGYDAAMAAARAA